MKYLIFLALLIGNVSAGIVDKSSAHVREHLEKKGFTWGTNAFIRIFKKENLLELWLQIEDGSYRLFRDYPICIYSGDLGPKTRQGDKQSPEGFYYIRRNSLNPHSRFYRSLNINYPNEYDRAHGYTGNLLMVHGKCHSIGCYAMGDGQISEIYDIVASALKNGQSEVKVHAFPFRMTRENLQQNRLNRWSQFWYSLQPAYDYFNQTYRVPDISVIDGQYIIGYGQ